MKYFDSKAKQPPKEFSKQFLKVINEVKSLSCIKD